MTKHMEYNKPKKKPVFNSNIIVFLQNSEINNINIVSFNINKKYRVR